MDRGGLIDRLNTDVWGPYGGLRAEAADEIERLERGRDRWEALAMTDKLEIERLDKLNGTLADTFTELQHRCDKEIERLRAALDRIATRDYNETAQEFARKALEKT